MGKILVAFGRRNLLTSFNTLNRKKFVELLADAWKTYLPVNNIISGFRETGYFPVDSSKFPETEYDQNKLKRFKAIRARPINQNEPEPIDLELNELEPNEPELLELDQRGRDLIEPEPKRQEPIELTQPNEPESISGEPTLANSGENLNIEEPTTSDGRRSIMDVFLHRMRQEFLAQLPPRSKTKQIRLKKEQQGEILTSKLVVKRLMEEEGRRKAKKPKPRNEKPIKIHTKRTKDQIKKMTANRTIKGIKPRVTEFTSDSDAESHLYDEVDKLPSSVDCSITGGLISDEDLVHSTNKDEYSDEDLLPLENFKTSSNNIFATGNKDISCAVDTTSKDEHSDEDLLPLADFKTSGNNNFAPGNNDISYAVDTYDAVDYIEKWYVGRIIKDGESEVKIKFLERLPENQFRWPKRDDIETVSKRLCFSGPIVLKEVHTFSISPRPKEIDKIWKEFKKSI